MRILSIYSIVTFITLSMLGTIKLYIGSGAVWFAQILLLFIALISFLYGVKGKLKIIYKRLYGFFNHYFIFLFWLLFMLGIAIAALENDGEGAYALIKYSFFIPILLILLIIPYVSSGLLDKALYIALFLSLLPLISFILFRYLDAMVILGDGRMGWLASWPGVIWKIGAFIWPVAAWRYMQKVSVSNVLLVFSSALIIALDGSRTAIVWMILVWLTLSIIVTYTNTQKTKNNQILVHCCLLLVVSISFAAIQPTLLGWVRGQYDDAITQLVTPSTNIQSKLAIENEKMNNIDNKSTPENTTAARLVQGDTTTRLEMLSIGWQQAVDNFPFGGGFGSTKANEYGEKVVIHMTYLQILADEGVVSLLGYLLFFIYPLYHGIRFVTEKKALFLERFEIMLTPLSVLILFLFMGLFHPLSNELSEWGIVLVAISIILNYVPRHK
ncbi:hypothetical protein SAMN05660772_00677 [Pasteurella testudinis DSM 23072]|uniref:O-antigen ligase like membrane protein n=1 Tax=Pasteurella testudinis DSM 23072 TaxID=1122938 RepID=A0A1W1URN9_9PAST|nr:hypothetical protein [Pasteurella testudinis]SMB83689.1 hypothetical protein SAMN05660772_00677 [Pasteurella testudinis DSM 23072]SUB50999.1 O-Antigen ligase [Pasteurella testudinis]